MALKIGDEGIRQKLENIQKNKNIPKNPQIGALLLAFDPQLFPYQRSSLLGNFERLALEIGSGWGEFTLESARSESKTKFIALEKKRKRVYKSCRDQLRQKISNVQWMVVDLHWFFDGIFGDDVFDKIVINFPDPWPKTRHQKHRFISEAFVETLARISVKGSQLEFASDYFPFVKEVVETLEGSGKFRNRHGRGLVVSNVPNRPVSFFEAEKRGEGENCYFSLFENIK